MIAKNVLHPIYFPVIALLLFGSVLRGSEAAVTTTPSPANGQIQSLPPMHVNGRALMGIDAAIACKNMLFGEVTHVLIKNLRKDGRAAKLGLLKGDEIRAINGTQLCGLKKHDVYALMEQVSQGTAGSFEILRKGSDKTLVFSWVLNGSN